MANQSIDYGQLLSLSVVGGYNESPHIRQLSGVFLLSACIVMRMRYLWQDSIAPVDDTEYQNIIAMIEETEGDLMTSIDIGAIVPSIGYLDSQTYLPLDGAIIDGNDYPELLAVVPVVWVTGTDIQLPDMASKGLFGENGTNIGTIIGENEVTLEIGQIPSHTHVQNPHSHTSDTVSSIPTAAGLEPALASLVTAIPTITGSATAINQNTGNDEPHNNIQSSLAVYWWIKVR